MLEIFTPVVHTINRKTLIRGARLVNKTRAEKNSKNRNKQTSDQEHEKKKKKEIRAVFFGLRLFSHSTLSSRLRR